MSELQEKLLEIKRQKDTYIIPENLKKNVTALGVTGTLEPGSGGGDVKLFETVEEMQEDLNPQEGDLAVVYGDEIQPVTEESKFDSCIFPDVVVLDEAITSTTYGGFGTTDMSMGYFDGFVTLSPTAYTIEGYSDTGAINIQYTSSDGITYTRTDGGTDLVEFGVAIQWQPAYGQFKSDYGKFMLITSNYLSGFYKYTHYEDEDYIKLIPISGVSYDSSTDTYTYDTSAEPIDKEISISAVYKVRNKLVADGILTSSTNYFTVFLNSNLDVCVLISKGSSYSNNVIALDNNLNPVGMMSLSYPTDTTASTSSVYKLDLENLTYTLLADNIIEKQVTAGTSSGGTWYYRSYTDIVSFCVSVYSSSYTIQDTFRVINSNVAIGVRPSNVPTNLNVGRTEYVLVDCQLDATADYVYGKYFYGKNGAEKGTLDSNTIDTTTKRDILLNIANAMQTGYILDENIKFKGYVGSTIPFNLDTSNVIDFSNMFNMCYNLTDIPNINTINAVNMVDVFAYCSQLNNVPNLDISNTTNVAGMFCACYNLTSVPNFNTINVTYMASMFFNCQNILDIPNFNTTKVTSMSQMFQSCFKLTTVPNFDTSNVTNMRYTFAYCSRLNNVPNFDTSNVTNMNGMFDSCYNITTIPNFDTSKVENMSNMFIGCNMLTSLPSLNTSNVTNTYCMFTACFNLIDVPSFNTSNVRNMERMFYNCVNLSNNSIANITNSLPPANQLVNKYITNIGLNTSKFTSAQKNILRNKGYLGI